MIDSFISMNGVNKSFGDTHVLRDINLQIHATEHCVIEGRSGSGKSTLLYLLGGLDFPTSGTIQVGGHDLSKMSEDYLAKYRNQGVGFIFQFHFLLPSMSCLHNILLPARIGSGVSKEISQRVENMANLLGVKHCLNKYPYQLSGGEQQRISIIRALSLRPKLLLCDEPTGNLDSLNSQKVIELIKDLAFEHKITLILVTHDERIASSFPRKITIDDGRIIG